MRRMIMAKRQVQPSPIVPDGYRALRYIENDGTTASITRLNTTNGKAYNNSGFEIVFEPLNAFTTTSHVIFGSRRAGNSHNFELDTATPADALGNGQIKTESNTSPAYLTTGINTCSLHGTEYIANGNTYTVTRGNNTWNYAIDIFGCREISSNKNASHCKIYSFKFYRGNVLKIDLQPCERISDGAVGFYDYVDETFYTNSAWTGG